VLGSGHERNFVVTTEILREGLDEIVEQFL